MRIVIDTNVLISGVFFGGFPAKVLLFASEGKAEAFASRCILDEYREIAEAFGKRKADRFNETLFDRFLETVRVIVPDRNIRISRDPDDDKFIECAAAAGAFFIVSGDKDLLVLKRYEDTEIITAKDFCERCL